MSQTFEERWIEAVKGVLHRPDCDTNASIHWSPEGLCTCDRDARIGKGMVGLLAFWVGQHWGSCFDDVEGLDDAFAAFTEASK